MRIVIRQENDLEPIHLCRVNGPEDVEGVVKTIARAGGVILRKECEGGHRVATDPTSQLRYDFILTEKDFYAEIVIGSSQEA